MKLKAKEKFAYGIGAVGKDMVYMLSASYILYYYQDIMGVSSWVMGIILLLARVFDAFNDPFMGIVVAKTKTKWGKFRPWLFIGTLTNAVVLYFMFACPPSLTGGGLVAYAAITYILWGVTYTMMDIPYWSMVPAFTDAGKERENLSAMARSCAGVGSAIITVVTVIAVSVLGNTFSAKNADYKTLNIGTQTAVTVVELDETGAATGQTLELTGSKNVSVTANATDYEQSFYFNESNCNFTVKVGSVELTNNDAKMHFAMDDTAKEAQVALYVSTETYNELAKNIDGAVSMDLTSTKEVDRVGFKYFSLIVAVLFVVFILITCICIKEKSTVDVATVSVKGMFKALFENDQAMAVVITIVLVNTAIYTTSNLLIYFFKYDLGGSTWEADYTLFNTFGGGMQILSMMLLFPLLRKFFSVTKLFFVSTFSAIFGYIVLLAISLSGAGRVYPFLVPGFFIFAASGIQNVLITVYLANSVDYGEIKNNRRDESVIFSMQTFVVKLASGFAALVASLCLSIFNISQSDNALEAVNGSYLAGLSDKLAAIRANGATIVSAGSVNGLRLVMALFPIFLLVLGTIVFWKKYNLTEEKVNEISEQLKAKNNA